jgi:hypothetical protein
MLNILLSLLPPYNLARAFSSYRLLEGENAELREKVSALEEQLTNRVDYILMLRGAPALDVVRKDKPKDPPVPAPARKSLRELRRLRGAEALAKMVQGPEVRGQQSEVSGNGEMAKRADEYAKNSAGA